MNLIRNPGKVLSCLSDLPGKPVIAKAKLSIQIPVRFKEIELAQIGATSFVYGLFAILLESGEYAVCNVNAMIELGKAPIEILDVEGEPHYTFRYLPGDVVFVTKELVAQSSLIFKAVDEFFFKGKVPWYVDYDDMGRSLDTAKKHAKTSADVLPSVVEFMAAYIARNTNDRTKFIRETAKDLKGFDKKNLCWVPMRSVFWSAPGTVNKLAGAYFSDGVVSALVNPSEKTEKIERILRS